MAENEFDEFASSYTPPLSIRDLPNYQDFIKSDEYKSTIGQPSQQAITEKVIDGKTYEFTDGATRKAYDKYMKSMEDSKKLKDLTQQEEVIKQKSEQAQQKKLTPETKIPFTPQKVKGEEIIGTTGKLVTDKEAKGADPVDKEEFRVKAPEKVDAKTFEATKVGDLTDAVAAKGQLSSDSIVEAQQGEASKESLAVAAVEELDPKGTVQYQLAELYKSLENGTELPAWASPAVRKVSAIMAQRGLGASSMAAAAITQAMMESGITIAVQDANKYSTLQLQNLTNKQQAAIQNATVVASMDTANLNNRQLAAVNNAKAFLSIDLQNLTNEQQSSTINFQTQSQALLTDAAQDNAAKQFNAKSQNEIEEFFAELGSSIETSTANRLAGLAEFNVTQADAIETYNISSKNAREQFNANMRNQIDQSNALWRRGVNTANTAGQNEINRQNAATLLGMQQQALNDLWQLYRDQASWTMKISENREDRAHNAAMQSSAISNNASAYDNNFENFLILKTIDNIFRPNKG